MAGGVDGTARLVHVVNKRILATLVHTDPTAVGSRTEGDMEVSEGPRGPINRQGRVLRSGGDGWMGAHTGDRLRDQLGRGRGLLQGLQLVRNR